ncbi:MAG: pilus assembly PilX N-terminal domain-containing protein [Acidobacteriia bacterium]|nr:pilus assembly PilX N-terminal domain-containing protein [Terriglobia bacterium]
MQTKSERGIALVLALFLVAALSVLGASLMFLSQTETYSSMNYRMMSQARYAGEAGIQKAANFLLDSSGTQYILPTEAQLAADYNYDVSPVTRKSNNSPVILSAINDACTGSNYPDAAMQTAFCNAAKGSLTAYNASISYHTSAKLLAMQSFDSYESGKVVIQTWEITGDGTLTGSRSATVEVVATVETPKMPAYGYAAYGTSPGCASLTFQGNTGTDSYDPNGLTGNTVPAPIGDGGDLGSNGNLKLTGNTIDIKGNLTTPRTGVGACSEGHLTAIDGNVNLLDSSKDVQLPATMQFPTPTIPAFSPLPAVTKVDATTCAGLGLPITGTAAQVALGTAQCNVTGSTVTINSTGFLGTLPGVELKGSDSIVLIAGGPDPLSYNFNSLSLTANATLGVSATGPTQGAILNFSGQDNTGTAITSPKQVIDLEGGGFVGVTGCPATCSAYDASMVQFVYGGTGLVTLTGHSGAAAAFYMPNANVTLQGNTALYGAVVAGTFTDAGNANLYYDAQLAGSVYVKGNPIIGTFTWKRY